MKAIGFNQGQYGDLCMNLIACRAFREQHPFDSLTFGINKKYADLEPVFRYNDLFNDIHIWDAYDNWPSQKDIEYLEQSRFDKVFNPMPKHIRQDWYLHYHQTEAVCLMHGLTPPKDLQIGLCHHFEPKRNKGVVAVNMFAATHSSAPKVPDRNKAKEYCELIFKMGYTPVQIGLYSDPIICDKKFFGTFFDTVKFALSCDFVFTVDSAMAWIMSGYVHNVLGIYNYKYYIGATTAKNWQPINPNAKYVESDNINIENDIIEESIRDLLV